MTEGVLTLSRKEAERLRVVVAVRTKDMTQATAALQLGVSVRQLKRLVRRYRQHGPSGLQSRRRGQRSNRRLDAALCEQVITLARSCYVGFGPTLLQEKLAAEHQLKLCIESVRGLLIAAGLWQAKPRRRKIYHLRERRPRLGELVQIDGSPHDWFEGRAERCCLVAFIDDATSKFTAGRFVPAETTSAYFEVLNEHLCRYGRPVSFYSDRHSIFVQNDREQREIPGLTQFGRALEELEIEAICALSPQAKGRVERFFQTCQDRLVKEMRLAGIASLSAANAFLPRFQAFFNERFAVRPQLEADAHRPVLHTPRALELILAQQTQRKLAPNLSFQYRRQLYQLPVTIKHRLVGRQITVCERSNGEVVLLHDGHELPYTRVNRAAVAPLLADDKTVNQQVDQAVKRRAPRKPSPTHPWQRAVLPERARS